MTTNNNEQPMEPLRNWLDDRMARGDIRYKDKVNGIEIYRIIQHPCFGNLADEQKSIETDQTAR